MLILQINKYTIKVFRHLDLEHTLWQSITLHGHMTWTIYWAATRDCQQCGMCDHQTAHTHSLILLVAKYVWVLSYWLNIVSSVTAKKEAVQACASLHLSKCHIVWKHMSRLKYWLIVVSLLPQPMDAHIYDFTSVKYEPHRLKIKVNLYFWYLTTGIVSPGCTRQKLFLNIFMAVQYEWSWLKDQS